MYYSTILSACAALLGEPLLLCAQPATAVAADTTGLTAALQQHWRASDLPGFAVAVVGLGGILYEHGFGFANKAQGVPYTPATVQGVGSVRKALIGVALLQAAAAAAGQLRLDQPVNELLPFAVVNPFFPDKPTTLRHLATITAGLTNGQRFYNRHAYAPGITSPDGGLLASTHSLARYLHSSINPGTPGAPLPPASRDSLLRPQFAAGRPPLHLHPAEPNQGLFWAHRCNGSVGHSWCSTAPAPAAALTAATAAWATPAATRA